MQGWQKVLGFSAWGGRRAASTNTFWVRAVTAEELIRRQLKTVTRGTVRRLVEGLFLAVDSVMAGQAPEPMLEPEAEAS